MARMATEDVDPRFVDLDAWSLASAMDAMWEGQLAAVAAVGGALPAITAATNAATEALGDRGRLIYVGAGTSGRVAVQDGAELPPTFAWPPERLHFIIAGGDGALVAQSDGPINHYGVQIVQTSQLQPGKIYIDWRTLTLPPDLPSGTYTLELVVYQSWDNTRLTLADGSDALKLEALTIP